MVWSLSVKHPGFSSKYYVFRNQFLMKHTFQQQEISEEKAKKRRKKRGVVRGWERLWKHGFH